MEVTTDLVTRKEDGLADLKLAYRAAKKKMNDAEQAIEQGVKLERLKHELVWSFVDEVDSVRVIFFPTPRSVEHLH